LVRTGSNYTGWTLDASGEGEIFTQGETIVLDDDALTLYARWTVNPTYAVTYHRNGATDGSVPVDSTHYEEGQLVTVSGNTGSLSFAGYSFVGWATRADGSGDTYIQGAAFEMPSGGMDLYAVWRPVQEAGITVTFSASYGKLAFSPKLIQASRGALLSVTCSDSELRSGASGWTWRVDGVALSGQNGGALLLDTSDLAPGSHIVDVFASWRSALYSGNLTLTLNDIHPTGISLSASNITIGIGTSAQVSAALVPAYTAYTDVEWSVDDPGVASVSSTGLVTGMQYGTTQLRVTSVDGGHVATCRVNVAALAKAASASDTSWFTSPINGVQAPDGSIYLVFGPPNTSRGAIIKMTSSGNVLWTRESSYLLQGVAVAQNGDILVTGGAGLAFERYSPNGDLRYAKVVYSGLGPSFQSITVDSSGAVYLAGSGKGGGWSFDGDITVPWNNSDGPLIVKYSKWNTPEWCSFISSSHSSATGCFLTLSVDSGGGIYAAGSVYQSNSGPQIVDFGNGVSLTIPRRTETGTTGKNALLVRYAADGTAQWVRVPAYNQDEWSQSNSYTSTRGFSASGILPDGSIVLTGTLNSSGGLASRYYLGAGMELVGADNTFPFLVNYDASGEARWLRGYNFSGSGGFSSLAIDDEANIAVIGNAEGALRDLATGSSISFNRSGELLSVRSDGTLRWQRPLYAGSCDKGYPIGLLLLPGIGRELFVFGRIYNGFNGTREYSFDEGASVTVPSNVERRFIAVFE
jgi:hypothetical protein